METMVLHVPDVTCQHCVDTISSRVGALSGVERVEVDLVDRLVVVVGTAERGAVCAAIDGAGYEVEG